ncbi:MAG: MBL fold metallo-hydrolase [Bacteroidota bacterium]
MNRRNFIKKTGLAATLTALSYRELTAKAFMAEYKMRALRRNVGVFTERGGTIAWMISPSGLVVVDTQFPEQAGHLIEEIKKQSERKIDLLINTHHHGDHSGGNIAFKDLTEKVVAHENSKANQERVAKARNREEGQLYPDTTYTDTWSQKVGDETISLQYFGAGHTNGDSLVHFEEANIVHLGDLLFNRRFPFIDRTAGASIANWIKVLGKAQKTFDAETMFVFGHAREADQIVGTMDDLKLKADFLGKLLETVEKEIKAGKSEDEILDSVSTIPGAPEFQGRGIQRCLTAAYQELTEK